MSLTRQIFLSSIGTDAFYEGDEKAIHKRLLDLYSIRKGLKDKRVQKRNPVPVEVAFWLKEINNLISQEKKNLTKLLNARLEDASPRVLNAEMLRPKSVISLFESSLTRALGLETNTLTREMFVVNVFFFQIFEGLVKNGFLFDGEKYVFLTASAGQIRTKKAVFIKQSSYQRVSKRLMCGLSIDEINEKGGINPNKYLAYLALCNSATDVWEDFDIDRSIVVDDFETEVMGKVDYIAEDDYSITRKEMPVAIPHMDGCGITLVAPTRMVRASWIKGLLVYFPFDKFIKEKCPEGTCVVRDIYGQSHDIIKENIQHIFTKSQFKLYKFYSSWEDYKEKFKSNQCEFCYCNPEEGYIPKAKINYQMLQTLSDLTDDEIKKITKRTVGDINKIGNDYQTTMRLLGATDYNQSPNYFQQGLKIYPELFKDTYHTEILKQTKKSLVKQAKGGRLAVNGRYQFISPDMYAFCEWLFLGETSPQGLLKENEVYSVLNRDGADLACLRSPHLYREWAIRKNNRNSEIEKWFSGTKCVYTSCHDLITRILMNDADGDKALVIQDYTLTNIAKRNMVDIVPLAYELRKAKPEILNSQSMYDGMARAYTSGNIGPVSNNITKIWNNGQIGEEQMRIVKWLCYYNNAVIDTAKTLWLPTPPKDVEKIIKNYTKAKVPHFFIYAKDKEPSQVEPVNNSVMNRISSSIPCPRVKYSKTIGKFDYRLMMNPEADFTIKESPIIEAYNYWMNHRYEFSGQNENVDDEDLWMYQQIREKILCLGEKDYIINTLIAYCYTVKINSSKKMLWSCFGEEIVNNLKINTAKLGNICPICGKRFFPIRGEQDIYCSEQCRMSAKAQYDAERWESGSTSPR